MFGDLGRFVAGLQVWNILLNTINELLEHFIGDAFDSLFVEIDVLVEELYEELDLGADIHALRSDFQTLFQAIHDSFLISKFLSSIGQGFAGPEQL